MLNQVAKPLVSTKVAKASRQVHKYKNKKLYLSQLRLERGGEHAIWACRTKMVISFLIKEISRHMIHQEKAYFQGV